MNFKVVMEGPYCLFLMTEHGHELAVYLADTPSGRGFDVRPAWSGGKPFNSGEIVQAAIIFTQEHTQWVSLPQPAPRGPASREHTGRTERAKPAGATHHSAGRNWPDVALSKVRSLGWPSMPKRAWAR